jgi:hypothetical protein
MYAGWHVMFMWKWRPGNSISEQFKDYLHVTDEQASLFVEFWLKHT